MPATRYRRLAFVCAVLSIPVYLFVPAQADPAPTLASVRAAFDKVEAANEALNVLNVRIDQTDAEIADMSADFAGIEKTYQARRDELATVIVQEHLDAPLGPTVNLLGSRDPQKFLDGLNAIQAFNTARAEELAHFAELSETYQDRRERLDARRAELTAAKKQAAKKRAWINEAYEKAEADFNRLSAADRNSFDSAGVSRSEARMPSNIVFNSAVAEQVVAFAYAQLGKPYAWGGTGPDSYDCSGLAYAAYASAGVSIPRTPPYGNTIPMSQIQPGDLLWTSWHVGIYIGGGRTIEATNPRTDVTYGSASSFYMASRFG